MNARRRIAIWRTSSHQVPWPLVDAIAAAGLTAGALVVLGGLRYSAPTPLVATSAIACTTTVGWRRRFPTAAALVSLIAVLIYERVSHDTVGVFEPVAVVLCFYTFALTEARHRRCVRFVVLLAAVLVVAVVLDAGLAWAPLAALPSVAALLMDRHRRFSLQLADAAARLDGEQAARAEQARVLERNRVARELHDVVAHSVSVMVIQAGAARLLAPQDAAGASDALRLVMSSGRQALGDLRRVMGVLHRDDPVGGTPRPGLADLDRLIEPVRATGLAADLFVEGDAFALPEDVDLVAYRLVQEALTNATKYAGPARARVRVRYQPEAVELEVTDSGARAAAPSSRVGGTGQGLIGMRERVEACGGQLEVGPTRDGYRVWAKLPARTERTGSAPTPPILRWVRQTWPWRRRFSDVLFAGASLVILEAAAVSYGHKHGWLWSNGTVAAILSAAALVRRRMPLVFLAAAAFAAFAFQGLTSTDHATVAGTYLVLAPSYTLAAWASWRTATVGLALWLLVAFASAAAHHDVTAGLLAGVLMGSLAWGAGRLVRNERDLAQRLEIITERLKAEREERARLAGAEERARLARRLQQEVAHLIVAMVVQAEVAETLIRNSERALGAIRTIETTGQGALEQMRHILGVLRSATLPPERQPQPGLAQLAALVHSAQERDLPVELEIAGMRGELPSSIDLAAYRIVEETLTLATTGRIVPLTIAICYADNSVELRLQAELPSSAWPSESLRERAAICHGTLRVDADGPGGSRLVARLPRALQGSLR